MDASAVKQRLVEPWSFWLRRNVGLPFRVRKEEFRWVWIRETTRQEINPGMSGPTSLGLEMRGTGWVGSDNRERNNDKSGYIFQDFPENKRCVETIPDVWLRRIQ